MNHILCMTSKGDMTEKVISDIYKRADIKSELLKPYSIYNKIAKLVPSYAYYLFRLYYKMKLLYTS